MDTDEEELAPTASFTWKVRAVVWKKSVFIRVHPWLTEKVVVEKVVVEKVVCIFCRKQLPIPRTTFPPR